MREPIRFAAIFPPPHAPLLGCSFLQLLLPVWSCCCCRGAGACARRLASLAAVVWDASRWATPSLLPSSGLVCLARAAPVLDVVGGWIMLDLIEFCGAGLHTAHIHSSKWKQEGQTEAASAASCGRPTRTVRGHIHQNRSAGRIDRFDEDFRGSVGLLRTMAPTPDPHTQPYGGPAAADRGRRSIE